MMPEPTVLKERAGLYALLRCLYEYPLTTDLLQALLALDAAPDAPLGEGLAAMQKHLWGQGIGVDALEALNVEMTRLFEGPGKPVAPPYASYYLNRGQLMGPAAQAARHAYLQQQVLPGDGTHLPADHLALELGFLAHLADAAASDPGMATAVLADSQAFLQDHLLPWLAPFVSAVRTGSEHPFFGGLARFTEQAIAADVAWLSGLLEDRETVSGNGLPVA